MTAIPTGTVVKDLASQVEAMVICYRPADDTVIVTGLEVHANAPLGRWNAGHAGLVTVHEWDSPGGEAARRRLRVSMLDAPPYLRDVALWVSDYLDQAGQVVEL